MIKNGTKKTSVSRKRKVAVVCIAIIAILAIAITLLAVSCTTEAGEGNAKATPTPTMESETIAGDNSDSETTEQVDKQVSEATEETPAITVDGTNVSAGQSESTSPDQPVSTSTRPAGQSQGSGGNASVSAPQKKWVEDTEQVWVEDKAAWSEQVPIYCNKEVSICNVCGADVTGNASAHGKAHMLAGEGSGHHSEVRQVITGYNTVSHAAEGHYETRVTGGHWE